MSNTPEKNPIGEDPRMSRLREVAQLMRIAPSAEEPPDAFEKRVKNEIDALTSFLSVHQKKLKELMRNPSAPFDEAVREWTLKEVRNSLDQVKAVGALLAKIQELDPTFLEREFTSRGYDLTRAEETINALNGDGKNVNVGGRVTTVRRDVSARTRFMATLTQIGFLLRSIGDGSMDAEKARADLNTCAEYIRNFLTKPLILVKDDPDNGWYEDL